MRDNYLMKAILIGLVLLAVLYSAAYLTKRYSQNRNDSKLGDVERLWTAIPLYPSAIEVGTESTSKDRVARVGKKYKSNASYDDVKAFYMERLEHLGWRFERERSLKDWWGGKSWPEITFGNGEYYLTIEYISDKPSDDWNYAISLGWHGG